MTVNVIELRVDLVAVSADTGQVAGALELEFIVDHRGDLHRADSRGPHRAIGNRHETRVQGDQARQYIP